MMINHRTSAVQHDDLGSAGSSAEQHVCDHAQLAERIADAIWALHQARLAQGDFDAARGRLEKLLTGELLPLMSAEDHALRSGEREHRFLRGISARSERRHRRQLREHRRMVDAVHDVERACTGTQTLDRAERVSALLTAHLTGEDHELASAPESKQDHHALNRGLATELDELVRHDHGRITDAMDTARVAATHRSEDELGSFDRVVSAVSHHAVVMSTRAYPMLRSADPEIGHAATDSMVEELRTVEHAIARLNGLLRGGAGGNPTVQQRLNLWSEIEQSWERHTAEEELLIRRAGAKLAAQPSVRLITLLRRPIGHSLTRTHPRLLGGGRMTRAAIVFQGRLDRARDELDNRSTWS